MGRVIVIEGTDSSGKETQTKRLFERLEIDGVKIKKLSFPNYESPACEPVKMYLAGAFGDKVLDINPYPVSTMFAIDRYASYKMEWENFYKNEGVVITDRYTTSNMVHQASKIENKEKKEEYLNWLEDLEYKKMNIPAPDLVIFLNMPTEMAVKLMAERKNKITGGKKKDIHEQDTDYLKKSYENACEIARKYEWKEIKCVDDGRLKTIEEIGEEIYSIVRDII